VALVLEMVRLRFDLAIGYNDLIDSMADTDTHAKIKLLGEQSIQLLIRAQASVRTPLSSPINEP
jgi:hypothetical protein